MADTNDIARKIRALLDKAENTNYPAEAEAATRKAAELMAAHRITEAMVSAAAPRSADTITTRTIMLSRGPYVGARMDLLGGVARAFGVRLVYTSTWEGREVELLGYHSDLASVELLYTSLLLQASVAASQHHVPRGHAAVTWRRGFLLGFAETVARRLREVMAQAAQAAQAARVDESSSVALVLADRSARVNAEYQRRYQNLTRGRGHAPVSHDSVLQGAAAGYRADLGRGAHVEGRRGEVGRSA
jgi:hypothetical protein